MSKSKIFIFHILLWSLSPSLAQDMVNPVIETYGGIYDIPEATVRPSSDLEFKVVIDLYSGSASPDKLNPALNNVARMINLHAIGGAIQSMDIVLAIHGQANDVVLSNNHYFDRYNVDNPNVELIRSLKAAGVKLTVCGQSLIGNNVTADQVLEEVDIATSMLTTVTTYQLKGYALLSF
ncbi:MAG: DsrE family protein [Cyclobacteriaceae bacterium]|nr:DsrE family protein [Cyclobacteriaceae bacterium]